MAIIPLSKVCRTTMLVLRTTMLVLLLMSCSILIGPYVRLLVVRAGPRVYIFGSFSEITETSSQFDVSCVHSIVYPLIDHGRLSSVYQTQSDDEHTGVTRCMSADVEQRKASLDSCLTSEGTENTA